MQQEQWQLRQLLDKNCGTTEMRKSSEFSPRLFYRIILSAILFTIVFPFSLVFCTIFSL